MWNVFFQNMTEDDFIIYINAGEQSVRTQNNVNFIDLKRKVFETHHCYVKLLSISMRNNGEFITVR